MKIFKPQSSIFLKLILISGLALLLQIPLMMVDGTISQRQYYGRSASHEIAQSWGGEQSIVGPILLVPYTQRVTVSVWDSNLQQYQEKHQQKPHQMLLLPASMQVDGDLAIEERQIGIFSTPVYNTQLAFSGRFDLSPLDKLLESEPNITLGQARVIVLNSDNRTYREIPQLQWNDSAVLFESGHPLKHAGQGISAVVAQADLKGQPSYRFELAMRGSEALHFSPVGKSTNISLQGEWPHPAFRGRYLPESRTISDEGFEAVWKTTSFASDLNRVVEQCAEGNCDALSYETFGVSLVEPVNIYSLSERSVKYGILFILLTFAGFFVFEVTQRTRIHPFQYLLVGFALTAFFMVLVALSEHIAFSLSYWIAALACIGLIVGYMRCYLKGNKNTILLGGGLGAIYAYLFSTLQSEDYALLMGSLLVFGALAVVMFATRHIDWYQIGASTPASQAHDAS